MRSPVNGFTRGRKFQRTHVILEDDTTNAIYSLAVWAITTVPEALLNRRVIMTNVETRRFNGIPQLNSTDETKFEVNYCFIQFSALFELNSMISVVCAFHVVTLHQFYYQGRQIACLRQ